MNYAEYQKKCDPEEILNWLIRYTGHGHLIDIKQVESLEKYLAVAPDVYVMAAMLNSILRVVAEQKELAEFTRNENPVKPWNDLTEEEKITEKPLREQYAAGMRRGRDIATIEMANRITRAARENLDNYRLENSEYTPEKVLDDSAIREVD